MEKSKEVLSHYVLSLSSIVYMLHFDYEVTDKLIDELAREHRRDVFEFHNALGEIDFETKAPVGNSEQQMSLEEFLKNIDERVRTKDIESASYKEIFVVLKDIDEELQNPRVLAMLKRMANDNLTRENYSLCVFVVGVGIRIPKEIEPFITLFEFPMPNVKEIQAIMGQFAKDYGIDISQKDLDELSLLLKGLNEFQIKRILTLEYQENGDITEKSKDLILVEKKQFIKKAGMLEIIDFKESMDDLGGLENLKTWLKNKARIIKNLDQAIKCGVDIPKGMMIVGMPGCGKSLAAKVCAKLFEIPLIRLDVGKLLGKYIGESESNMQKALRLTEAINPCVLWIDEVEKAFSGIGRGGGHEVTT
ncbi:MAG: AAA family ATPase [Helicobacter sp.]|nr:AAA family ATPase [Helicobacter sp.]